MWRMPKVIITRALEIIKALGLTFLAGCFFAVLCFVLINAAMEPVSKSQYCGTACHEMDSAFKSWQLSIHGGNKKGLRAECIDCHLPSKDNYFTHLIAKGYAGGKDTFKHLIGSEYDVEKNSEKILEHMKDERCMSCHVDILTSELATETHREILTFSDPEEETRCVDCHEEVGHQR